MQDSSLAVWTGWQKTMIPMHKYLELDHASIRHQQCDVRIRMLIIIIHPLNTEMIRV